jgi:hypothetical protein
MAETSSSSPAQPIWTLENGAIMTAMVMPDSFRDEPKAPTVTETARLYLAGQLDRHAPRHGCFRLRREPNQRISTTVAEPSPDDLLVRHEDRVVLAIEADLAEDLRGGTIDVQEMPDGRNALIVS